VRLCEPLERERSDRYSPPSEEGGTRLDTAVPGEGGLTAGARDPCGQATKGVWGMSWRQEATKGVEDCEKPGGAVKRALIPGCPNHPALNP
jgi:hypothetical protein